MSKDCKNPYYRMQMKYIIPICLSLIFSMIPPSMHLGDDEVLPGGIRAPNGDVYRCNEQKFPSKDKSLSSLIDEAVAAVVDTTSYRFPSIGICNLPYEGNIDDNSGNTIYFMGNCFEYMASFDPEYPSKRIDSSHPMSTSIQCYDCLLKAVKKLVSRYNGYCKRAYGGVVISPSHCFFQYEINKQLY